MTLLKSLFLGGFSSNFSRSIFDPGWEVVLAYGTSMGTRTLLLGKLNGGWVGHLGIMTWEIDGNLSHLLEAFEFFNKLGCLLRDLHKMKVEDC